MVVVWLAAGFLIAAGAAFVAAAVLPRGVAGIRALRSRLELHGAFETAAALVSGVLFLASGGAVLISLDRYA
jgi:hypothetical protein